MTQSNTDKKKDDEEIIDFDMFKIFEAMLKTVENMGDIIDMTENIADRHVNYDDWGEIGWLSTAYVVDNPKAPYETAIRHVEYGNGQTFILETYDAFDKARKGHSKWKKVFESPNSLPEYLEDQAAGLFGMFAPLKGRKIYRRVKK
jgi:hypothetical protein